MVPRRKTYSRLDKLGDDAVRAEFADIFDDLPADLRREYMVAMLAAYYERNPQ